MRKFQVKFTETVDYEVEFESEKTLDELRDDNDHAGGERWFNEMDASNPNWLTHGSVCNVTDRDVSYLEEVPSYKPKKGKPAKKPKRAKKKR